MAPLDAPEVTLVRVFNDCQQSQACHRRCVKEIVKCRRQYSSEFTGLWTRCIFPLFTTMKREPSVERLVKFVSSAVTYRDEDGTECDEFVEQNFEFLVGAAEASNKCVRYRSCQIISEIILSLAEEAEIDSDLWDELTACMQRRMQDKVSGIRVFASRALSRLFSGGDKDVENDPTILQYKLCLSSDPSAEVRRAALLSLPVSNGTIADIVERTHDASDAVRKAAYSVLGNQVPIQSLSIRQRALVLQRGLIDREPSVQAECRRMLKAGWLSKDCSMDPLALLRYLDVETNDKEGEAAMEHLLREGAITVDAEKGLKDYFPSADARPDADRKVDEVRLMEPEEAVFWRMVCNHLNSEAQAKRLEAANTRGAKADVLEAEAAELSETLDAILPATVSDFVVMIEAHYLVGPTRAFVSRQLLMLAELLDFTDTANRKAAAALIDNILLKLTAEAHYASDMFGDGIYLGGEKEWSDAVAQLGHKVHAAQGAFEEALARIVVELARPCREGGASVLQWLQCLSVTGLFLENLQSLHQLPRDLIDSQEMLDGLLLPAATHPVPEVQRAALRCLSLFSQLEEKPSSRAIDKLEDLILSPHPLVKEMAVKGIFDLVMCHGAATLDKATGADILGGPAPEPRPPGIQIPVTEDDQKVKLPVMETLLTVLNDSKDMDPQDELEGEVETASTLAAQGFAKLLIQKKVVSEQLHTILLPKLLQLYFHDAVDTPRLKQCLSVFFLNYASISPENKQCIASIFVPTLRDAWPGISKGSNPHTAAARKQMATRLARFMLELIKQPLFSRNTTSDGESCECFEAPDDGQELLAISLAAEVRRVSFVGKPAIVKPYKSALCRALTTLEFRPTQHERIKAMRKLLDFAMTAMSGEKVILKEMKALASRLKAMDQNTEELLTPEQLRAMLNSLNLGENFIEQPPEEAPTPAARTTTRKKKQASDEEDDIETPKLSATVRGKQQQQTTGGLRTRSQRTCKTVAIQKMQQSISKTRHIDFEYEDSTSTDDEDDE